MLIRTLTASVLLALTPAPCLSQQAYPPISDIKWSYGEEPRSKSDRPTFRLSREGHMSSFDGPEAEAFVGERFTAALARPGDAVSFVVHREAGAIACSGTVIALGRASGTCRFDPEHGFIAQVQARNLAPKDSDELLVLALVDARMASVDSLSHEGFEIAEVDTVIALAALGVTPEFARSLRQAGLVIADTDNLIAAKAVGIDPAWLRGMVEAGYAGLDVDRAIQMRALDITPDYARKMSRVMAALQESGTE
jgi:hypothetical protein